VIITELVTGPIDPFPSPDDRTTEGAEIRFNGRVRGTENGQSIKALQYEYYPGMTEHELRQIAEEACAKFSLADLWCRHRMGTVKVGEVAIQIVIWSAHRQAGLQALDWFLNALKTRVPIWKWVVTPEGATIPSGASI
jgi:molybdopterin synthase catalytic subunit